MVHRTLHKPDKLTGRIVWTEDEGFVEASSWIRGGGQPVACWEIRGDHRDHASCCPELMSHNVLNGPDIQMYHRTLYMEYSIYIMYGDTTSLSTGRHVSKKIV